MKSFQILLVWTVVFLLAGNEWQTNAAAATTSAAVSNEVWSVLGRFVNEKYELEETIAKKRDVHIPSAHEKFFAAARSGDWNVASNLYDFISSDRTAMNSGLRLVRDDFWNPVLDVGGAWGLFADMDPKFLQMYGVDMIKGIPPGAIYFGGTDPGRFLVSAFSDSHNEGRPFFTLTQNALMDPDYIRYIAELYSGKIKIVDTNDLQMCMTNYLADAGARARYDEAHPNGPRQVRPGEDVRFDSAGRIRVTGQVSSMCVNALIARLIFERNPASDFYVEESFPLDWMFPHLTPHGLILKLNHETLPKFSEEDLKADHEFWAHYSERLIGNWITYDTTVKEVMDFTEKVYQRHDLGGFKGDAQYLRDNQTQKIFSKMRCSIGGVYSWRLGIPPSGGAMSNEFIASGANRSLIEREADFAYKQACAFCPANPEAVYRYVQLLINLHRVSDAQLVAETARKLDPNNASYESLIKNLKNIDLAEKKTEQLKTDVEALEKDIAPGSTNFTQQFEPARKLIQLGQNDRAYRVLDAVLFNSHASVPEVMTVADAYSKLGQLTKLQGALEALTRLVPNSPEAWYDLAAVQAARGQNLQAVGGLKTALELNDQRLAKDPAAKDLRLTLKDDKRFAKLRGMPEFDAAVEKP